MVTSGRKARPSEPWSLRLTRILPQLAEPLRFLRVVIRRSLEDKVGLQASALAFASIVSLVPLLAALSFVGTRIYDQYQQRILELLTGLLPYPETSILEWIDHFLDQAESIQPLGALGFVVVSLGLFGTIEGTLNRIWRSPSQRPLRSRLLSFTLLLFWGPALMGAAFSLVFRLRQSPTFGPFMKESLLLGLLPFAVSCLGLTMLYWLVPQARVRFMSAVSGGVTAAILLELVRQGFGLYLVTFRQATWVVYGSFALVLFFMLSIQLGWSIILVGSEISYVSHHWRFLSSTTRLFSRYAASWMGLGTLVVLARRLLSGQPLTPRENLVEVLTLSPEDLNEILAPLIEAGVLQETNGTEVVLATIPDHITVEDVLAAYDTRWEGLFSNLSEPDHDVLKGLFHKVRECRQEGLSGITVASLLEA